MGLFKNLFSSNRKRNILLCVDRDGTLIYDNNYHLGKDNYWKSKIKILPNVLKGMKLFEETFPKNSCKFIITNQPGVAIEDFKRLTLKRAQMVTKEVQYILKRKGVFFDGFVVCPHANVEYVKEHPEYNFKKELVCNKCDCVKPKTGMIEEVVKKKDLNLNNTVLYVIGDRSSDVQTAINAGGIGILVPFENRKGELPKTKILKKKYPKRVFIAKDFLDAINLVIKKEK